MRREITIRNDRVTIGLSERMTREDRVDFEAYLDVASTCGAAQLVLDLTDLQGAEPADLERLSTARRKARSLGHSLLVLMPKPAVASGPLEG